MREADHISSMKIFCVCSRSRCCLDSVGSLTHGEAAKCTMVLSSLVYGARSVCLLNNDSHEFSISSLGDYHHGELTLAGELRGMNHKLPPEFGEAPFHVGRSRLATHGIPCASPLNPNAQANFASAAAAVSASRDFLRVNLYLLERAHAAEMTRFSHEA